MKLKEIRHKIAQILFEKGVAPCAFEADTILKTVLKIDTTTLITNLEQPIDAEIEKKLIFLAQKRAEGYPLQYLMGSWEFYGREFLVGEGVLIPRPDTETVIDVAKKLFAKRDSVKAVDLCSGTGCIAITLEKEISAEVFALEKSEPAYSYLLKNIELNDSKVIPKLCDILDVTSLIDFRGFDLVVSNPPYIKTADMQTLSREVKKEPAMALDGGKDGLRFYREIARLWKNILKMGGYIIFEIGNTQAEQVCEILEKNRFFDINVVRDLENNPRVVYGRKG